MTRQVHGEQGYFLLRDAEGVEVREVGCLPKAEHISGETTDEEVECSVKYRTNDLGVVLCWLRWLRLWAPQRVRAMELPTSQDAGAVSSASSWSSFCFSRHMGTAPPLPTV